VHKERRVDERILAKGGSGENQLATRTDVYMGKNILLKCIVYDPQKYLFKIYKATMYTAIYKLPTNSV